MKKNLIKAVKKISHKSLTPLIIAISILVIGGLIAILFTYSAQQTPQKLPAFSPAPEDFFVLMLGEQKKAGNLSIAFVDAKGCHNSTRPQVLLHTYVPEFNEPVESWASGEFDLSIINRKESIDISGFNGITGRANIAYACREGLLDRIDNVSLEVYPNSASNPDKFEGITLDGN